MPQPSHELLDIAIDCPSEPRSIEQAASDTRICAKARSAKRISAVRRLTRDFMCANFNCKAA